MSTSAIAGYRVVRQLGAGGMGQVFLVEHPRLPRQDALKLLDAGVSRNYDFKGRFLREADLLAQLSHPNIVTLHDRGEFESRLWITMEYIDGTDAGELVKADGALDPTLALELITGAGAALDHAWRKQRITHRDVKPANILLGVDGAELEAVKLADFGIAKAAGEATSLTSTGITVGTIQYISPEAIEGEDVDNRADVYSLGCTAFHLLTGQPPYTGKSITALMNAHLTQSPPSVAKVAPQLPAAVDEVFATVLAKAPDDRYQSCAGFGDALRAALEDLLGDTRAIVVPAVPTREVAPDAVTELREVTGSADEAATQLRGTAGPAAAARKSRMAPILAAVVAVLAAAATVLGVYVSRSGGQEAPAAVTSSTTTVPAAPTVTVSVTPTTTTATLPVTTTAPETTSVMTTVRTTTAAPTIYTGMPCDEPGATSPDGLYGCSGELGVWKERNAKPLPTISWDAIGKACTQPGAKARLTGSDGVLTCTLKSGGYVWVSGPY